MDDQEPDFETLIRRQRYWQRRSEPRRPVDQGARDPTMDDFVDQFAGEPLVATMRLGLPDGSTIDAVVHNDVTVLGEMRDRGWIEIAT